jgi:DNA (cytosine-5)-methyltransferase 1
VHVESRPYSRTRPTVLSLFSGAGGLDLGLEAAGFEVAGCVELDRDCRNTLAQTGWPLSSEGDIHAITPRALLREFGLRQGEVTLLAGGPPCQPFSKSGLWVNGEVPGMRDPRSRTLMAYFAVLEASLPVAMLLENVRGITYAPKPGKRREQEALDVLTDELVRINARHGTSYVPQVLHLNAVDYGVPQSRERVFVFACRDGASLIQPEPTHGPKSRLISTDGARQRHATAWDAIGDLDSDPSPPGTAARGQWAELLPSIPEGCNYAFHTPRGDGEPLFGWRTKYWSFLLKLAKNRPAWTIQAQPGPATGPFHWRSRRLSVREMARLQTFPDSHRFSGGYDSARRQVGNAVPVSIGELVGREIRRQLLGQRPRRRVTTIPELRDDCPAPEPVQPVPQEYLHLRGTHPPHPGPGNGPGARLRMGSSGRA